MTTADQAVLQLAFGGPLSLMCRLFGYFGVPISPTELVDDDCGFESHGQIRVAENTMERLLLAPWPGEGHFEPRAG